MEKEEIIETLGYWVKSLTYTENDDRTDAALTFKVTGMDDSPIRKKVKKDELTDKIVREFAEAVAGRFCDAHTVEELDWNVAPTTHRRGVSDWALTVYAGVHLAYNDYEDEEDDSCDEEGEEMDRQ